MNTWMAYCPYDEFDWIDSTEVKRALYETVRDLAIERFNKELCPTCGKPAKKINDDLFSCVDAQDGLVYSWHNNGIEYSRIEK